MPMEIEEKRQFTRRSLCIPIKYWELNQGKPVLPPHSILTKDISEGGLAFQSDKTYELGTKLLAEMKFSGRKNPVITHMKVIRIESPDGESPYLVGATFPDLSPEERSWIASALDKMNLYSILQEAIKQNASDLHLTVGSPPALRIQGNLLFLPGPKIEDGEIQAMFYALLTRSQMDMLESKKELDFAFSLTPETRFRVNLHYQKNFLEAAVRMIPSVTKSFRELGLPVETLENLCRQKSGLILIAGRIGAGTTTTVASMIDYMNNHLERVIITLEDPIEYLHVSRKSIVKQREIGADTQSFTEALRYALRQDPDIIVGGELFDFESIVTAIRAAETGHLVIATVHAPSLTQSLEKLTALSPIEHTPGLRQRLASCLNGILFQALIPDKKGRLILATELLVTNPAIKNLIRTGKFETIPSNLQTGGAQGMHTIQARLKKLYTEGIIDYSVVEQYSKTD